MAWSMRRPESSATTAKQDPHNKHNVEGRDMSIHVWALMILN